MVLIVSQGRDQESDEVRPVFGRESRKAGIAVPSSVSDTSPSSVRPGFHWCRPFCRGTLGAEGEAGVLDMSSLFTGLPQPAEHPGGGAQAKSSPGLEALGTGTQSEQQLGVSGMLGVNTEGG